MKYKVFYALLSMTLIVALEGKSQSVGINIQNPQQLFHIDAAADNSTASATRFDNDIIINSSGRMAVGVNPATALNAKLTFGNGLNNIKIRDTHEGAGKLLVSDNDGYGTWTDVSIIFRDGPGFVANNTVIAKNQFTRITQNAGLTVTRGTWMVIALVGFVYKNFNAATHTPANTYIRLAAADGTHYATSGVLPESAGGIRSTPQLVYVGYFAQETVLHLSARNTIPAPVITELLLDIWSPSVFYAVRIGN